MPTPEVPPRPGGAFDEPRAPVQHAAFFHNVWNHSRDGMFILRPDGDGEFVIEGINPSLERRAGLHSEALIGTPARHLVPRDEYPRVAEQWQRCVSNEQPVTFEHRGLGNGQRPRTWRTLLVPVPGVDGDAPRIYGICHDVTNLRRAREVLRRGRRKLEQRFEKRVHQLLTANHQLHELATLDPLTGSYNRRYFFELAEREVELAHRHGHPLSAVMLDVDRFKSVNDTYGHATGDRALEVVAKACRRNLRGTDIFGRYGGEEFAVVLPDTPLADALQVAEKIRRSVEHEAVETDRGVIVCTVSIGVAGLHHEEEDLRALLHNADLALLRAKRGGRNRVEFA